MEGLKEKKRFRTPPDSWTSPKGHPGYGQLFGVLLPIILKQKVFKIFYCHKFHFSFEKNYLSPNTTQKITKKLET